ncbi:MAG: glycosyltransferase [Gemmatimonadales bacterium]
MTSYLWIQAGPPAAVTVLGWVAAALYLGVFLLVTRRYATRRPRLRDYAPTPAGPLVSVIIPARNEAHNIERCARSILAARYQTLEVIVVDDRSTDGTREIVGRLARTPEARGRLALVSGTELEPGWFGKQWALVQGYRVAQGELLLFADADTRHGAELIARAVAALERESVDLVSLVPRQEMVTFWERLVQPHVMLALQARVGDLRRVNRTRIEWEAIANGQFILVTRASYEAVGTHEAVRGSVVDDVSLAQAYVRHGRDIFLAHAPEDMSVRMYRSLGEIVEGWSKNLALGAPLMAPPIRLLRGLLPWLMWLPVLVWVGPPVVWAVAGCGWAVAATLISLALWLQIYWRERAPPSYALLYPVGAMLVAYIMIRSAWRGAGRVEWKGRVYGQRDG